MKILIISPVMFNQMKETHQLTKSNLQATVQNKNFKLDASDRCLMYKQYPILMIQYIIFRIIPLIVS